MSRKKNQPTERPTHYGVNPDISIFYEFKFGKETISTGDMIKFKDVRGTYKFIGVAHNAVKNVSWIDCLDSTTGEYRAFYVDKLKGTVKSRGRNKTNG